MGWVTALVLCLAHPALAESQRYSAPRFDVSLEVLAGGDLRVSETITFDFESGTFTKVWRTIPANRTDGIEILEATMDGAPMPEGSGPGHVEINGRDRTRVEWHFSPVSRSTHQFGLRYVARGVGVTNGIEDRFAWRPLPTEHAYSIAASRITAGAPQLPIAAEVSDQRGIDSSFVTRGNEVISADVTGVRRNGWLTLTLRFPPASLVKAQPQWQQRAERMGALAPRWIIGAGSIVVFSLMLMLGMRPRRDDVPAAVAEMTSTTPPDALPPAVSAALLANGHPRGSSGAATLLDLADRGVLTIAELPRQLGVRGYQLSQVPGQHHLADHEEAAITIAFGGQGNPVTLSKARGRLARQGRRFSAAVREDMHAAGLIDEQRYYAARHLTRLGITALLLGVAAAIPIAILVEFYGAWPLLVPLAIAIGGVIAILGGVTLNVLSHDGAIRAARWRGFKRHLKGIVDDRRTLPSPTVPSRFIVYGVALGLAAQWSRYAKRHPDVVPPWFAAGVQDSSDAGGAFAGYISSSASYGANGGAGAGAGAAGGGGSGAG